MKRRKPLDRLIHIYLNSVGGNATFLLNIPPDRRGQLHENDVQRLREFGAWLRTSFRHNLMQEAAEITGMTSRGLTNAIDRFGSDLFSYGRKPGKKPGTLTKENFIFMKVRPPSLS